MQRNRPSSQPTIAPAILVLGAALLAVIPMMAAAQTTGGDGTQTYILTPQQKAAVLDHSSESAVDASLLRAQNGGLADHRIHGEIGMMIGTHDTRGIYGDAVVPLGNNAIAGFSFEDYQTAPGRFRWHHSQ